MSSLKTALGRTAGSTLVAPATGLFACHRGRRRVGGGARLEHRVHPVVRAVPRLVGEGVASVAVHAVRTGWRGQDRVVPSLGEERAAGRVVPVRGAVRRDVRPGPLRAAPAGRTSPSAIPTRSRWRRSPAQGSCRSTSTGSRCGCPCWSSSCRSAPRSRTRPGRRELDAEADGKVSPCVHGGGHSGAVEEGARTCRRTDVRKDQVYGDICCPTARSRRWQWPSRPPLRQRRGWA